MPRSRAARERSPNLGGEPHPRLNTCERPIANKYREGKMKRTLKRESKAPEIVGGEAIRAGLPSSPCISSGELLFCAQVNGMCEEKNLFFSLSCVCFPELPTYLT